MSLDESRNNINIPYDKLYEMLPTKPQNFDQKSKNERKKRNEEYNIIQYIKDKYRFKSPDADISIMAILCNDNLKKMQKIKLIKIIIFCDYFIENIGTSNNQYDRNTTLNNLIVQFCNDRKNTSSPKFTNLLDKILSYIEKGIPSEEKTYFFAKLEVIFHARKSTCKINNKKFYAILNQILSLEYFEDYYHSFHMIKKIFDCPALDYSNKTLLAISDVIENRKSINIKIKELSPFSSYSYNADSSSLPYYISVISNKLILSLDDDSYKIILRMLHRNTMPRVLSIVLAKLEPISYKLTNNQIINLIITVNEYFSTHNNTEDINIFFESQFEQYCISCQIDINPKDKTEIQLYPPYKRHK